MRRTLFFLIAVLLCLDVSAATRRWVLHNASFDDGGRLEGWIEVDSVSGVLLDFDLRVSGGNEIDFPAIGYSPSGGNSGQRTTIAAHPVDSFQFSGGDGDLVRTLNLTPSNNLEGNTGSVALDPAFPQGNDECVNCSPIRFITGGSFWDEVFSDGFDDYGGNGSGGGGGDGV